VGQLRQYEGFFHALAQLVQVVLQPGRVRFALQDAEESVAHKGFVFQRHEFPVVVAVPDRQAVSFAVRVQFIQCGGWDGLGLRLGFQIQRGRLGTDGVEQLLRGLHFILHGSVLSVACSEAMVADTCW